MGAARAAWQAAGHWSELLPLCALQADLAALRTLLASVRSRGALRLWAGGCTVLATYKCQKWSDMVSSDHCHAASVCAAG